MKLYIYEHCPFSARVRFIAAKLNIAVNIVTLDYDDEQTTVAMTGSKQVPVLVTACDKVITESLDIIAYFFNLDGSDETNVISPAILDWQGEAFLPLQKIGYPRWFLMNLKEFTTGSSKQAWRNKKQTDALNFAQLLADTPVIADQVSTITFKAKGLLGFDSKKCIKLIDAAVIFSILRGFFSAPEVNWDYLVCEWMLSVSKETNIQLLK